MDFGHAITGAKAGHRIARPSWHGKGQFVYYVPEARYPPTTSVGRDIARRQEDNRVPYRAYLALMTTDGDVATWQPTISDTLADDWVFADGWDF
jgi:hypothetical protein